MLFYSLFFVVTFLISETTFRLSAYESPQLTIWVILFAIGFGLLFGAITLLFKEKARKFVAMLLSLIVAVYYGVNLVYQHIFLSILSLNQIGMGTDAIANFHRETWIGIKESVLYLIVLFLPLAFLVFVSIRKGKKQSRHLRTSKHIKPKAKIAKEALICLIATVIVFAGTSIAILTQPASNYGAKELFTNNFVLSLSESKFGTLFTTLLEAKNILLGNNAPVEITPEEDEETYQKYDPEKYNALDIDFDSLKETATNSDIKSLDEYFASKLPSMKNEYTGKYKDYNVITLLCESFSPYLIDKYRTPTLYKLANEGIKFTDYYSCNNNNTSNSEYAFLTSLIPDESLFAPVGEGFDRFREYNSCVISKDNYEPFTLANELKKQGIRTVFYHNYLASYYNRDLTHGNFGYEMVTMNDGLKYSPYWPTSDYDLMTQAMPDLLKPNKNGIIGQFHAYFLTFSGHMAYNFETNQIAINNQAITEETSYSEEVKAYVSCNYELEKALKYMLKALEDAGELDNTLIVLAPDHYPYGLGIGRLSELAPKYLASNKDEMELNTHKGCLLMWTPSMAEEEQVEVDYPVSELDVLPTLLNMCGVNFDSRLLMGTDIFADSSRHFAMFEDRSFVTKDFYYNMNTGNAVSRVSGKEVNDADLQYYINLVKNKFTLSNNILYLDYYRHVFGK